MRSEQYAMMSSPAAQQLETPSDDEQDFSRLFSLLRRTPSDDPLLQGSAKDEKRSEVDGSGAQNEAGAAMNERLRKRLQDAFSDATTPAFLGVESSFSSSPNARSPPPGSDSITELAVGKEIAPSISAPLTEREASYYGWTDRHIVLGSDDDEIFEVCT
ncbi:hypothetical protein CC86DRAFT_421694 [Ophiobolus disseminans]|uniref:Uncharacterized protein n=1 Tax=Ophiobolus disseminans TaxID=1469910 RepID=A0A6A6ZT64_9PLEO|nr:hypothetical protein CC86DRAFT_421694 [Ophiobolus disseminans]